MSGFMMEFFEDARKNGKKKTNIFGIIFVIIQSSEIACLKIYLKRKN